MERRRLVLVVLASLLWSLPTLSALGGDELSRCGEMGILIDDATKRFSVTQGNVAKPVSYNDIGCAMIWRENQCTAIQTTFDSTAVAFDFLDGEEVPVDKAYFVRGSGIDTPMHFGVVAFKSREAAERFVEEHPGGIIVTYEELLNIPFGK